jgi:sterol desaturase/sphingolipid hydroxylase (fatty acid hydroxylase superfamily)
MNSAEDEKAMAEMSAAGMAGTLAGGVMAAELVGYTLHRAMHSGKFPRLSRAHMIHHMVLYEPHGAMRAEEYRDATEGRASVGNIGMEWVLPIAAVLTAIWIALWVLGISWVYRTMATTVMVGWAMFMFSYIHDGMHVNGFWMERIPWVRQWYVKARRLHDIHHRSLNDSGKMDRNFGIGFFVFDRVFGTLRKRHCIFNRRGYREALKRYADLGVHEELEHFPKHWGGEGMSGEDHYVFSGARGLRFRESLKGFGEGKAAAKLEDLAFHKEQREP